MAPLKGALLAILLAFLPTGETVEVVLKNSKTIKGELVRENLKGITVAGSDQVSWTAVDTVNGKSARERLAQVKLTQKNVLCQDCKGGLVTLLCPECQGLGKVYAESKPCDKCSGTGGSTACPVKGCDKGKVECPGPCLKRSVGNWKDMPGFGICRTFLIRDDKGDLTNAMRISDHHLGEVWEYKTGPVRPSCTNCGATKTACKDCREATHVVGPFKSLGDCKICGGPQKGASRVACTTCFGSGTLPCTACMGTKSLPVLESLGLCKLCKEGLLPCALCESTGLNTPGRNPKVPNVVITLRGDLRQALEKIEEGPLTTTDRATFRDGRSLVGTVLQRSTFGVFLALRSPATQDLQVAPLFTKHGFRLSPASGPFPSLPAADDKKTPPAAPGATPDTVVLKDGTTVSGKIVAKSEELLMVQTPDGKFVKIEASKVAEIRTAPKK
jgi:hypothetical protein